MSKGTLTVRILGDASGFEQSLNSIEGGIGRLGKFAAAGVAAMGAAVVGGVALSIKSFADFDQAMTQSTAIMGDVSDAMRKDMSNAAREVAKTTKFSATEAAESYFFLASAGMDAAQSIEALPKVAAFAQAGNFDMARATDLLTDAQSALGLVVDDTAENIQNLTRVSDVLVRANTMANASVEQFSEALTNKAGTALRQLNKDVEEGVAVLSVYADAGVKGSAAGIQLNAVLEGLTRTARLNADAYDSLGVAVFDNNGEMRHMADIVGDLEGALAGMSTEQQLAELAALGLTRQARDGTVALLGTSGAIREYDSNLRDAAGFTDQVANKQMETFWAQLGLVKDQLLDVALSVGQALMPALMGFTDWLQAKLPAITGWFDRITSKFTDMLGTAEESTAGSIVAMDSFSAMAKRRSGEVVSSLSDIEGALDSFEAHARRQLAEAGGTITIFRDDADKNLGEADEFMARMSAAWKTVWDEDLGPWLKDEVPAWIIEEFLPAVGSAMGRAGATAGKAFVDGLVAHFKNLPGFVRDALDGADAIGGRGLGGFQVPRIGGGSSSGGRSQGGTFSSIIPMADGGIVRARPGGTLALIGEAGRDEAVVPLPAGGRLGGTVIEININGGTFTSQQFIDEVHAGLVRKLRGTPGLELAR